MIARAVQSEGHALDRLGRLTAASSHFMIAAELWRALRRFECVETCEHLADSCSQEGTREAQRRIAWRGVEA